MLEPRSGEPWSLFRHGSTNYTARLDSPLCLRPAEILAVAVRLLNSIRRRTQTKPLRPAGVIYQCPQSRIEVLPLIFSEAKLDFEIIQNDLWQSSYSSPPNQVNTKTKKVLCVVSHFKPEKENLD